jgi:hypothetical protein
MNNSTNPIKVDLNIDNYDLNDLLNLFKLDKNFDEEDLKQAKKIVLKTHPDKSGLNPDYFRFYSAAYKSIYGIWQFKNKKEKDNKTDTTYTTDYDESEKNKMIDTYLSKEKINNSKKFNKWFNEQFEQNKMEREDESAGYGDWLKSNEGVDDFQNISQAQLGEEIERKKQQMRALTVHKGIQDLHFNSAGASDLIGDAPDSYGSDLFSNLKYEDLRKAHTETVVPVTIEDYNNTKKFKNVNDYKDYRNSQSTTPLSEIQAREYLSNKGKLEDKTTTERAYKLAKQLEESKKKQEQFWSSIRHIQ